jgi:FkbM family methyltransferase
MSFKHELRRFVQRFGVDVVRYPLSDPLARVTRLLQHHRIDCVVDVGANDGGFASSIRRHGYVERIISFEPLQEPFDMLARKAFSDGKWDAVRCAVGDATGEITINVSGNAAQSSSVLPMLNEHARVAPGSRYVRTETVRQDRLDQLLPKQGVDLNNRTFLKVDVQGYEKAVLEGAHEMFEQSAFLGLQLELSLVPLYDGAMTYLEAFDRAESLGLTLVGLDPVFADPDTGRLLQADAVFFRS